MSLDSTFYVERRMYVHFPSLSISLNKREREVANHNIAPAMSVAFTKVTGREDQHSLLECDKACVSGDGLFVVRNSQTN